jgi:serine/threonine-protein kinase
MGDVYLARDLALERTVAIKFIAPDKAADPSARRRLVREARAAAALEHPNICGVYEVIVEPDGRPCIVMQYIEGDTLAEVLRRGPLDVRFALRLASDLASALAAAHRIGIIHGDVKPQNVMITPERRAKLLDFGLARHHQLSLANAGSATTVTELSRPGIIVGTPAYMSPEQVQQRPADGRSDLFSLGALLYECFTGTRAFKGTTPIDLASQVLHHQPPDVSTLRLELTPQHDELCRRLLAKDPDDRFQSAEELAGALRVFTADSAHSGPSSTDEGIRQHVRARSFNWRTAIVAGGAAVLAILAVMALWPRTLRLEPPNAAAAGWYHRGTEAIRDGAYHSGRLALSEAIKAAPEYAPSYIRMAEAETELGEVESAQRALLKASSLVRSESRLPFPERKRVEAVRALMLRDVDGAVRAYSELAASRPDDPGAWLDLGRAQDAAALSTDARASYERAIEIDAQLAAAHLRRASVLGLEGRRDEALQEFSEAERLYRAAANVEGEVETLIRRGRLLNNGVELRSARAALERAVELAGQLQSRAQQIRAKLALSTVTASEGLWAEAETMAGAAVESALLGDLEAVAADGLIDLATPLILQGKHVEADAHLRRAIQLAEKRGAQTIVARGTLQRAALMFQNGRPADSLAAARAPLEYFQASRYRRYELTALSVMARAHEELGHYAEARTIAERALDAAIRIKDDTRASEALESLAGQANALGALPDALEYRARGLEIHRRQNDIGVLPFDLINRADLLIRVGRHAEGSRLLDEVDAGIAKKLEAYLPRRRRAVMLRALSAAIQHRHQDVLRHARDFPRAADDTSDSTSRLMRLLAQYAEALDGKRGRIAHANAPLGSVASANARELRYWDLAGRLLGDDARGALSAVAATLADPNATVSREFEWRIAAIGAAAARELKELDQERMFNQRARQALATLRQEWKADVASYEARQDLAELRRRAGLN